MKSTHGRRFSIQLAMVWEIRRSLMKSVYCFIFVLLAAVFGLAQQPDASNSKPAAQPAPRKVDKAAAYYHYTVAHMYEEQVAMYGRSELANKAIEEYRLA